METDKLREISATSQNEDNGKLIAVLGTLFFSFAAAVLPPAFRIIFLFLLMFPYQTVDNVRWPAKSHNLYFMLNV
jgi:hypothetical protein